MTVEQAIARLTELKFRLVSLGQQWHDNRWFASASAWDSSVTVQPIGRGVTPAEAMAELVRQVEAVRPPAPVAEMDMESLG